MALNQTLQRNFVVLMSIVLIVTNVAAYFIYRENRKLDLSREWVAHSYRVIDETRVVFTSLLNAETGQRGYLLTGSSEFLKPYEIARTVLNDEFGKLKILTRDNSSQQKHLAEMDDLIKRQIELLDTRIQLRGKPDFVAVDMNSVRQSKTIMDRLRIITTEILREESDLLTVRLQSERVNQKRFFSTLLTSSGISLFILLFANGLIIYTMGRQKSAEANLASAEHELATAEQDLSEASQRLALTLQTTSDGLVDWTIPDGRIFYSQRFKDMLGLEDDFIPTVESFSKLLHEGEEKSLTDLLQLFFDKHDTHFTKTLRLQHKGGSWQWHLVRGMILYDSEQKPIRVISSHTDITQLKSMEESLRASNKELEEFTYIASHDLRSPLVNLKGFASELSLAVTDLHPAVTAGLPHLDAKQQKLAEEAIEEDIPMALQFIHSSVERMDRLTNAILELSRIGRREFRYEILKTHDIVDRCLNTLRHQIDSRGINVTIDSLPEIMGDPVAMEQVFGNIIDNAIKYLDPARKGDIRIYGVRGPSETTFHVRDNGRGIAAADMKKIFEIFRRAGDNKDIPGEGMGMAYIRAILRRHGGDIKCMSEPGVGTTFFFTVSHTIKKETKDA